MKYCNTTVKSEDESYPMRLFGFRKTSAATETPAAMFTGVAAASGHADMVAAGTRH